MTGLVERIDEHGRPAWLVAIVAGFVVFPPLGLAVLAFLVWTGRLGFNVSGMTGDERRTRWEAKIQRMQDRMASWQMSGRQRGRGCGRGFAATGNRAFDEYRHETVRRLEDEAEEFRTFLDRLRQARDKAEFDQFMAERRGNAPQGGSEPPHADGGHSEPHAAN